MQEYIEYAPIIIVVVIFLLQQRLVVTPEQLERKHRHILAEADDRYAKLDVVAEIRERVYNIDEKLTKLCDVLLDSITHIQPHK